MTYKDDLKSGFTTPRINRYTYRFHFVGEVTSENLEKENIHKMLTDLFRRLADENKEIGMTFKGVETILQSGPNVILPGAPYRYKDIGKEIHKGDLLVSNENNEVKVYQPNLDPE